MNKKLLEDKDLSKQEVVLLIFTAKSKAGFIEAKKDEKEKGDDDSNVSALSDEELDKSIDDLENNI